MSRADALFLQNCRDILDHGVWDTDLPVRPHWFKSASVQPLAATLCIP